MTLRSPDADAVELACEESGSGQPPVLLLHGWSCDRSHLAPQREALSGRHRAIAFDLRGHGESPAPTDGYSIEQHARDVAHSCTELDVDRPFVVGHSMGGIVALALALQRPEWVRGIVLLDSPIFLPPSMRAAVEGGSALLHTDRQREVVRQLGTQLFFLPGEGEGGEGEQGEAAVRERILDGMCATPEHVVSECWESMFSYDVEAAAKRCRTPALYVGAERALCDLERACTAWPGLGVVLTPGVGHFHQIFAPGRVNHAIERFFTEQRAAAVEP